MTNQLILKILNMLSAEKDKNYEIGTKQTKIPTLENNVYRAISPMLQKRFLAMSYFLDATNGDWLSINEMEQLWTNPNNERIRLIKNNLNANIKYWEDNAGSLFKKDRLTLFAGSAYTSEHIYLLWLDSRVEPELWVYNANGMARYKNLDEYLISYINDDLTSYEKDWLLSNE